MRRTDDSEVPVVERGDAPLAEALKQRDDARIDDSQLQIGMATLKRVTALEIGRARSLDAIRANDHVVEERQPDVTVQTLVAPVVELGKHERRDDEILGLGVDERGAWTVIGIGAV